MSDVDLLVVETGLDDWLRERVKLARYARREIALRREIDLIVMSREHYRRWRTTWGTVQHEAHREGILVARLTFPALRD